MNELLELYNKLVSSLNNSNCIKIDKYIRESDFLIAPASRSYHHSYEGGLLEHCFEVYRYLKSLNDIYMKLDLPPEIRFMLAFGHDLSKTNFYIKSISNKKIMGEWKSIETYSVEDKLKLPHQVGSIRLIKDQGINLDINIERAILFHHGAFDQGTLNDFSDSCKRDPYTLILHTADMLSATYNEQVKMPIIRKNRGW